MSEYGAAVLTASADCAAKLWEAAMAYGAAVLTASADGAA